ncbi:HAD family hydrolase [Thermofilum pendens]|uniref:HAD-superfamily hydrolase, subfamily IIB n=1 Tax=Thermofilum pendens (strain DSM 2475 / Hrk 5) TaxID=368408 RepID=A1RZ70_THEPD|nr:HAD family hydrolase [Thermofilum pendens]ABL78500.1 HAD-superfamily hydrolase, subfamily IIB [Thermofilum pendens Hrk 5]
MSGEWIVVSDYDGTLAEENREVEPRVLEKLEELKAKYPFKFVIATARPLEDISRFVGKLWLVDALILEVGSVVALPEALEVIFKPWGWDRLRAVLRESVPAVNEGRVLYYVDEEELQVAERVAREKLGAFGYDLAKVGSRTYAFMPRGIDKGVGLERLLKLTGWSDAMIVSIGDSRTDLPLFQKSKVKVAVGNAAREVKEKADIVCEEKYGDCVVRVIEEIVNRMSYS